MRLFDGGITYIIQLSYRLLLGEFFVAQFYVKCFLIFSKSTFLEKIEEKVLIKLFHNNLYPPYQTCLTYYIVQLCWWPGQRTRSFCTLQARRGHTVHLLSVLQQQFYSPIPSFLCGMSLYTGILQLLLAEIRLFCVTYAGFKNHYIIQYAHLKSFITKKCIRMNPGRQADRQAVVDGVIWVLYIHLSSTHMLKSSRP